MTDITREANQASLATDHLVTAMQRYTANNNTGVPPTIWSNCRKQPASTPTIFQPIRGSSPA